MTKPVEIHPAFSKASQMWLELQPYQRPLGVNDIMTVPGSANLANLFCEAILDSKYGTYNSGLTSILRNTGYTTSLFKVAQQDFVHKRYSDVYVIGSDTIAETAKAIDQAGVVSTTNVKLVKLSELDSLKDVTNSLLLVDNDIDFTNNKIAEFITNHLDTNKIIQMENL